MHMNEYVLEALVRERLAEMRAEVARSNRVWTARQRSQSSRGTVLGALIGMRRRLHSLLASSPVSIDADPAKAEGTSSHGAVRG